MKFFIVDAFTDTKFGGNPAGVVLIPAGGEFPEDEVMVKTAAELRYSETAFLKAVGENEYQVRYFTPAAEVDLCGHATIGSFFCLKNAGLLASDEKGVSKCTAHTLAGDIEVTCTDDFILMDMAEAKHISTISDPIEVNRLYEIMGGSFDEDAAMYPTIISTGLPDIMMPVGTLEELNSLSPDFSTLAKFSEYYKVVGVHAFTLDGDDATCHTRNFAPLYDIDEEAATGTSSGALTYYLDFYHKLPEDGRCTFIQGEAMGRPSVIKTQLEKNDGHVKIRVGGPAVVLAEGEINL